jgi:hypothetical protein
MLRLEDRIAEDKLVFEKIKIIYRRFLKDLKDEKFISNKVIESFNYTKQSIKNSLDTYSIAHVREDHIFITSNNNRCYCTHLQITEKFEDLNIDIFYGDLESYVDQLEIVNNCYNNLDYYSNKGTIKEKTWEYYHQDTLQNIWAKYKTKLKILLGIDLEEIYGET